MPLPTVLILGGTAEARALAAELVATGQPAISSLAGRVVDPALPAGRVRIGGFGGPTGLADYLRSQEIDAVVDATHPFAVTMSASAVAACRAASVPLLRLARPGWAGHPDAGRWQWVDSAEAAAIAAADTGARVFLTSGRTTLPAFAELADRFVLVRLVDAVDHDLPDRWLAIRARGPYTVQGETALMRRHGIDVLVTKDSGGAMTAPKLTAAAELGVPVVIIGRPAGSGSAPEVETVEQAAAWCREPTRPTASP